MKLSTSATQSTLAMTPAHAPVVAALHDLAFSGPSETPWDAGAIARLLAMPGAFGFLGLREDEPHGFILCRAVAGESEILTLGVIPDRRRSGLGKELVNAALTAAAGAGAERMVLEVAGDNPAALGLYKRLGFSQVGRRPKYYRRAGKARADALILSRPTATP